MSFHSPVRGRDARLSSSFRTVRDGAGGVKDAGGRDPHRARRRGTERQPPVQHTPPIPARRLPIRPRRICAGWRRSGRRPSVYTREVSSRAGHSVPSARTEAGHPASFGLPNPYMKLFATKHSHAVLYLHAVWATKDRAAVLDRSLLFELAKQTVDTARTFGAAVLAFGGAPDHVHVLLRYRPGLRASGLVRGLKAALTRTVRRDVPGLADFSWQSGYGAFSVGASELDRVVAYISDQERHHTAGTVWPDVEFDN